MDTKKKMDKFLDSFDKSVTLRTAPDQHTSRSIEHTVGTEVAASAPLADVVPLLEQYRRDGFVVLEDVLSAPELAKLQAETRRILDTGAALGDNSFYGTKTKRAYSMLAKTRSFDPVLVEPRLVGLVNALFHPNPLLGGIQLIEIFPGEAAQKLHFDTQFLNSAERGDAESLVNFILAIDDFTLHNGATVVIPGSHVWPKDRLPTEADARRQLTMRAGSACMFSGKLWHGGGENASLQSRRGAVLFFQEPWLRTLENHFLAIPFAVAADLDPQIQSFIGYSLHHPFTGQVDFQHPRKKLMELAGRAKL